MVESLAMAANGGSVNPREFWNDKILAWEAGRYGRRPAAPSWLERLADRASDSLRFRLELTGDILQSFVHGKRVLELGCGSGLLAERLIAAGAREYVGLDIAAAAIENARRRAAEIGLPASARFEVGSAAAPPDLGPDIVFSLGLFDWLGDDEIDALFVRTAGADFLHSISEKRGSPAQLIHRLYCHVAYGYRTKGYVPRYLSVAEVVRIARRHGAGAVRVCRHPRLRFGVLLTTLPIQDAPVV